MRILTALTYYRPHYSGLTVYSERLARTLASRGNQVTVLTSRYSPSLPAREVVDGVEVRRLQVAFRVSKGVIMPALPYWALRLGAAHDVVHLHLPQLDAALLAVSSRFLGKPVILTYHCELRLPRSAINWLANGVSHLADRISLAASHVVVTNTRDYAEHSALLRQHLHKLVVIAPPVEMPAVEPAVIESLRRRLGVRPGQRLIGMAARLATEKGAEVLARALPHVMVRMPEARVLYVGQYQDVLGEEAYARRLDPLLRDLGDHWTFLGLLPPKEMAAFFALCEVTVLPSLNSTESFGMVQVESMICGTPVVASDLPGVRQPTSETGMGMVVPPADPLALAGAIVRILGNPSAFQGSREEIAARYAPERAAEQYEQLFERLLGGRWTGVN
jgi:glycosyltransferase involved in cell wall biosynthesis